MLSYEWGLAVTLVICAFIAGWRASRRAHGKCVRLVEGDSIFDYGGEDFDVWYDHDADYSDAN